MLLFALAFDLGVWVAEGAHGWPFESLAIAIILLFNAGLGLYQEQRSDEAMARLKALGAAQAWTVRDGQLVRTPVEALVPGDYVRLETGEKIPADGTLCQAHGILLDESLLTGESVPVEKADGDDVFSGTLLIRGSACLTSFEPAPRVRRDDWPQCSARSARARRRSNDASTSWGARWRVGCCCWPRRWRYSGASPKAPREPRRSSCLRSHWPSPLSPRDCPQC